MERLHPKPHNCHENLWIFVSLRKKKIVYDRPQGTQISPTKEMERKLYNNAAARTHYYQLYTDSTPEYVRLSQGLFIVDIMEIKIR